MNYNVLKEPWIGIETKNGELKDMGIYEALKNAHNITRIAEASPFVEYGIYRTLIAFVMDAYRFEDAEEISELYERGSFDMDIIDNYISDCQNKGDCFNLFDKERPFLQSPYNEDYDKDIKSIANLFHNLPGGNNDIHFDHRLESQHKYSAAYCAKGLCAANLFCFGNRFRPASISGSTPLYVLIKGNNLFEELVFNCVEVNKEENNHSVWFNDVLVKPGKQIAKTSLLFGLTWPCRRLLLIPEGKDDICDASGSKTNITVKNLYMQAGLNYKGSDWTDPHISYYIDEEKGKRAKKPQKGKSVWRDVCALMSNMKKRNIESPKTVQNINLITESQTLSIKIYGLITPPGKEKFELWIKDQLSLPVEITKDERKLDILQECIALSENVAYVLTSSLKRAQHNDWSNIRKEEIELKYYDECRSFVFNQLTTMLKESGSSEENIQGILDTWAEILYKLSVTLFNEFIKRLSDSVEDLIKQVEAQKFFFSALSKVLDKISKKEVK